MRKSLFHLLMHLGQLLEEETRSKLHEHGLYHGQGRVLDALFRWGDQTQADLARGLHIKPATVTDMLKRMEISGLITRKVDPITNRAMIVSLTSSGKEAAQSVRNAWESIEKKISETMTPTQREDVIENLEKVRNILDKDPHAFCEVFGLRKEN